MRRVIVGAEPATHVGVAGWFEEVVSVKARRWRMSWRSLVASEGRHPLESATAVQRQTLSSYTKMWDRTTRENVVRLVRDKIC